MAGTRVTTAPSAILVVMRLKIIAFGATPFSRVMWKKADQPDEPLAPGKDQHLVGEGLAVQLVQALDDRAVALVDAAPAGDRVRVTSASPSACRRRPCGP
jgi:hypothetical protein